MPELPEVETIRRHIASTLVGRTLLRAESTLPKLLRNSPIASPELLSGRQLIAARRRAKILSLEFSGGLSLLVHFKLAGQFAIMLPDGSRLVAGHPVPDPVGLYPHSTSHMRFDFEGDLHAWYSDVRQFGWMRIVASGDVEAALAAFGFGPEATERLDGSEQLLATITRRSIPIKALLLDQTFIAGLGNIYVDESLWQARVHPGQPASALRPIDRKRLLTVIPGVMEAGIAQGGVRIVHQRAYPIDGFPAVHGREGKPCIVCSTAIRKIRVAGRGTYHCPTCQRLPRARTAKPRPIATGA